MRRARGWLVLGGVLAVSGGLALAAWTGARRTASSYPRLLESTAAFDVFANPAAGDMDFDRLERLPGVAATGRMNGVAAFLRRGGGLEPDFRIGVFAPADRRATVIIDRPQVVSGRLADPDSDDEAVVTEEAAKVANIQVGERVGLVSYDDPDVVSSIGSAGGGSPPSLRLGKDLTVRVVGIVVLPEEAMLEPTLRLPRLLPTYAFFQHHRPGILYRASYIRLVGGERDIDGFVAAARKSGGDGLVFYQTRSTLSATAARITEPSSTLLDAFAITLGFGSLLLLAFAMARQIFVAGSELAVLSTSGMSRRQLVMVSVCRAAVSAVIGSVGAVALAVALSPLAPIGAARPAEPHPGLALDTGPLAIGALALVVAPIALAVGPAWRIARVVSCLPTAASPRPRSALVARLTQLRGSPVASIGARMALDGGSGPIRAPVRLALAGATVSVALTATSLVFGDSVHRLLATPRLYGGNWDVTFDVGAGEAVASPQAELPGRVAANPYVRGLSVASPADLDVDGRPVAAIGLRRVAGNVDLTLLAGRQVRVDDEAVVGTGTLRRLGKRVGDQVRIQAAGQERVFRIVGRAVFPYLAGYAGSNKLGLGDGLAITAGALAQFAPDASSRLLLIDLSEDHQAFDAVRRDIEWVLQDPDASFTRPERPEDLSGYGEVDRVAWGLSAVLVVLVGGVAAYALVSGISRRRRELAVLEVLGLAPNQLMRVVAVQASLVAAVGILIGIPFGCLVGWSVWNRLADHLGAVPRPVVDPVAILVLALAVVFAANAIAAAPGRAAARTTPAAALRGE